MPSNHLPTIGRLATLSSSMSGKDLGHCSSTCGHLQVDATHVAICLCGSPLCTICSAPLCFGTEHLTDAPPSNDASESYDVPFESCTEHLTDAPLLDDVNKSLGCSLASRTEHSPGAPPLADSNEPCESLSEEGTEREDALPSNDVRELCQSPLDDGTERVNALPFDSVGETCGHSSASCTEHSQDAPLRVDLSRSPGSLSESTLLLDGVSYPGPQSPSGEDIVFDEVFDADILMSERLIAARYIVQSESGSLGILMSRFDAIQDFNQVPKMQHDLEMILYRMYKKSDLDSEAKLSKNMVESGRYARTYETLAQYFFPGVATPDVPVATVDSVGEAYSRMRSAADNASMRSLFGHPFQAVNIYERIVTVCVMHPASANLYKFNTAVRGKPVTDSHRFIYIFNENDFAQYPILQRKYLDRINYVKSLFPNDFNIPSPAIVYSFASLGGELFIQGLHTDYKLGIEYGLADVTPAFLVMPLCEEAFMGEVRTAATVATPGEVKPVTISSDKFLLAVHTYLHCGWYYRQFNMRMHFYIDPKLVSADILRQLKNEGWRGERVKNAGAQVFPLEYHSGDVVEYKFYDTSDSKIQHLRIGNDVTAKIV